MAQTALDVEALQQRLREFADERAWRQFHTPKNLAMALAVEAGELLEVFQWLTPEQSIQLADDTNDRRRAQEELADVLIYAIRLADILGIDVKAAIENKIDANAEKYPVGEAHGSAEKYSRRGS